MTAICFDLDGTLANAKPGITRSIQYALAKLGRAAPSEDKLRWCVGPPLRASLKKLLGTDDLADNVSALPRAGRDLRARCIHFFHAGRERPRKAVGAKARESTHRLSPPPAIGPPKLRSTIPQSANSDRPGGRFEFRHPYGGC